MSETVDLGKFLLGKNNVEKETSLPERSLRDAVNVDIDNAGNIRLRSGRTLIYSGTDIDSLYKRYFREGGNLKYLETDNTATTIGSISGTCNYCEVNGDIYLTDGSTNYTLSGTTLTNLSIEKPLGNLTGTVLSVGSLRAGKYQIACAFTDGAQISGVPLSTEFELTSSGSITLNVPQPVGGYSVIIYMNNGKDGRLLKQVELAKGITSYTISSFSSHGVECQTQFMDELPAGHIIQFYRGRAYVANGSTLWFSEPMRYGLTKTSSNFFSFAQRISVCLAVENGIFVVADKSYFLVYNVNKEARLVNLSDSKGVEGTGLILPGKHFNLDTDSDVAYWFASDGATLGLPDGSIKKLTKDVLAVPDNTSQTGVSLQRESNGTKQVISSMSQDGEVSNFQADDSAVIEVIRNGIVV